MKVDWKGEYRGTERKIEEGDRKGEGKMEDEAMTIEREMKRRRGV